MTQDNLYANGVGESVTRRTDGDDLLRQLDEPRPSAPGAQRLLAWSPIFLALAALFLLLGWGMIRQQNNVSNFGTNDGPLMIELVQKPADNFSGALYESFGGQETLQLSDLEGQTVVLNFWASWCPPCREEADVLEAVWRDYQGEDVVFVGVNMWEDAEAEARAYLAEFDVTYPNISDERGRSALDYGLTGLPETYFITPDGMVSQRVIGAVDRATLEAGIDAALAGGEDSAADEVAELGK